MVNISRFGEADDRVDEDVCLASAGGTDGEFTVGAVHGIASLEGDDTGPAEFLEVETQFGGGVAEGNVVVVVEAGDGGDGAANVVFLDGGIQVFDCWVLWIAAEDGFGLFLSVWISCHACLR